MGIQRQRCLWCETYLGLASELVLGASYFAMKWISAAVVALLSSQILAAGSINARVTSVRIDQSGNGMIFFDQNVTNSPGCVISAYLNALAFNTNTAAGKSIYAMGLAAKAQGSTVVAYGLGS